MNCLPYVIHKGVVYVVANIMTLGAIQHVPEQVTTCRWPEAPHECHTEANSLYKPEASWYFIITYFNKESYQKIEGATKEEVEKVRDEFISRLGGCSGIAFTGKKGAPIKEGVKDAAMFVSLPADRWVCSPRMPGEAVILNAIAAKDNIILSREQMRKALEEKK